MAGKENETRLPVVGSHANDSTLIRLHEERMGRTEARLEQIAEEVDRCLENTDRAINTLRKEFVDTVQVLRDEIHRRPTEVILYIVIGAALVLGGDTVRGIAERLLP